MTIDIHKVITGNPITKNLMKPWGSNAKPNSLRGKIFNLIQDLEIQFNNKLILILIQVKYIKFMILPLQKMIDVVCYMM